MYESPISIMFDQMRTQMREEEEKQIVKAVQNIGISVDKDELIKALQYDREQYSKGYKDRDNEIVRCKDCKWYEPAHILHDDGSKTYVDENAPWVTAEVGINVGGQCIDHSGLKISCVNHNREDPEDYENIVIFRRPNEYCSCGERRE